MGGVQLALVRTAILATNAHNTQPWLFRLSADRVELFAVLERNIGTIDSLRREMYISLGCALENLALAAVARGFAPAVQIMPDPTDQTFAARMDLSPSQAPASPLYAAIPARHTNRAAFAAGDDAILRFGLPKQRCSPVQASLLPINRDRKWRGILRPVHEVGLVSARIAQAIQVAREAGATRVERLTFAIAPDGHVTPEALHTLVAALAHGTIVEGAVVEVVVAGAVDHVNPAEIALTSIDVEVLAPDEARLTTG